MDGSQIISILTKILVKSQDSSAEEHNLKPIRRIH